MNDNAVLSEPNANWLQRWEQNNIGWHHEEFNPHLTGHWHRLNMPPETRVLVPLCGKSRDMAWLADQGHSVFGVELSPLAVETFFAEQNLRPERDADPDLESWRAGPFELLCGDIFALTRQRIGDLHAVYDRASLVALNPRQRRHYAELIADLLPSGSRMLLVAMDYDQQQMPGPPFSVSDPEVHTLYDAHFDVEMLDALDLIQDSDRYREKGLTRLIERVYALKRL